MIHFILNIATTVYFGIGFILTAVSFICGPLILNNVNKRHPTKYGTTAFLIELFGFVFSLFFLNVIFSQIGLKFGIQHIPVWFSVIYSVVTLRNMIYNMMFSEERKFSTHFGIEF